MPYTAPEPPEDFEAQSLTADERDAWLDAHERGYSTAHEQNVWEAYAPDDLTGRIGRIRTDGFRHGVSDFDSDYPDLDYGSDVND